MGIGAFGWSAQNKTNILFWKESQYNMLCSFIYSGHVDDVMHFWNFGRLVILSSLRHPTTSTSSLTWTRPDLLIDLYVLQVVYDCFVKNFSMYELYTRSNLTKNGHRSIFPEGRVWNWFNCKISKHFVGADFQLQVLAISSCDVTCWTENKRFDKK